jgi:hypothetical protein
MNVINHGTQGLDGGDIAIVAATRLPEAMPYALALVYREPGKPLGRVPLQVSNCLPRHRLLHRLQKSRHLCCCVAWVHQEVNMIGHQYVDPNLKAEFHARFL